MAGDGGSGSVTGLIFIEAREVRTLPGSTERAGSKGVQTAPSPVSALGNP
jgi:hypothetical protein